MSLHVLNTISNRLSLRPPQRDSLEILQRLCEIVPLQKDGDRSNVLQTIQSEFSAVLDFERDFPSLCFALATGVGKTRLMGAFISYLYASEGIRNFMILAPNLTIYNKLYTDFTPNTSKYVFKGIGDFSQNPPILINGDNYENGTGTLIQKMDWDIARINIFNISKITAKDGGKFAKNDERRNIPRIRRLSEYIGQSYFEYLAGLDDLVILMDESHRYRADAGLQAINELSPILGLELTATPQIEKQNKTVPFKNVIYNYPLPSAMDDGFVKEPAVATRENFNPEDYDSASLEKLKLEDGIRIHENTKVELDVYARNSNQPVVKPFMLVVAQDTRHANDLEHLIESTDFFDGRYAGKVITVHSNIRGEEKEDVVQQLLTVEDPENPVEIVIHVNMLKEGWDVTNLYTIVPLRAANSKTLVEQSIGRGLRLPYGKRVGVPAVDRLTIVSHDKFQEIIDYANNPDSVIRKGIVIGKDIPSEGKKAVTVPSKFDQIISPEVSTSKENVPSKKDASSLYTTEKEIVVAQKVHEEIKKMGAVSKSKDLLTSENQHTIVEKVKSQLVSTGDNDNDSNVDIEDVVERTTKVFCEYSIDIPKIIVVPEGEVVFEYDKFSLDTKAISMQPVAHDILIKHLHNQADHTISAGKAFSEEERLEDYLVRGLIDFDDICYDDHAELLYDLSNQLVNHLKSYLKNDDEVLNVLQYHQKTLVEHIHSQMQAHFTEKANSYAVNITKGFISLRPNNYTISATENPRKFREPLAAGEKSKIKSMIFGGFSRCLYPVQKFDSDSERRFAIILEKESEPVVKWFKPGSGTFHIHYNHTQSYEPDFVVETDDCKYLCEPKQAKEMDDDVVLAKAKAAAIWCEHASAHALENDSKPWKYLLIPHDKIQENMTLDALAKMYQVEAS